MAATTEVRACDTGGQVKLKEGSSEEVEVELEEIIAKSSTVRYFFQNKTAGLLAEEISSGRLAMFPLADIEYNIKALVVTDNPVFMKW